MLRNLARLLRDQLGENDVIARLGGDEFGVIYQNLKLADAKAKASQLCRVAESFQFKWDELRFTVGLSIGVVSIDCCDQEFTELLKQADLACYLAKELGRNQAYVAGEDDQLENHRSSAMTWIARVDEALSRDQFILYAQPIVNFEDTPSGIDWCELLIRMQFNDQIVLPGEFLPAAEKYGRIGAIDRWVIENALQWISLTPKRQQNKLYSINVSAHSVSNLELLSWLLDRIEFHCVDGSCLCFEITETTNIRDMDSAKKFILAVQSLGCKVALDDFGKGMSSFDYLKSLNVDVIKLYGGFVESIGEDKIDYLSVKAVAELGLALGKVIVAESVSSESILQHIRNFGINHAQGFYLGEPVPLQNLA